MDYSEQPPRHVPGAAYTVLVPRVDADGNELGGIRAVGLQAPLGTHTGWSLRATGYMEDAPCYLNGFFVPFAATAAQRLAAGDPRPSLEERYGSQEGYVAAVTAAARDLVAHRLLLPEDAGRLVAAAEAQDLGLGAVSAGVR
jgi:hypothetical protein